MRRRLLVIPFVIKLLILPVSACDSSEEDPRAACSKALAHLVALQTAPPPDADTELRAQLDAHRVVLMETSDPAAHDACAARPASWSRCVLESTRLDDVYACNDPAAIDQDQGATP